MSGWLKRVRGAIGMGVAWAGAWAVGGVLIGVASVVFPGRAWSAFFRFYDAPLPTLAIPGFIGGIIFSIVLGIAANRKSVSDLSIPRFAAWGALSGLLLSAVPDAMVIAGMATRSETALGIGPLTTILAIPLTILCAGSAAGSLWMARRAIRRDMIAARESLGLRESSTPGVTRGATEESSASSRERSHVAGDRA